MKNNHTEERTYTKQTEQREPGLRTIHITRDLFCDWQEGKLKEPEELQCRSLYLLCGTVWKLDGRRIFGI